MANRNEHNEFETAKWDAEEVRRRVIDGPQADQPRRLLARFAEVFAR